VESAKPFEISKRLVWEAYLDVKSKGGAAGVDTESIEEFEVHLKDNLYRLWNRLSSGSYFPPPVKAVPIPKKSGGTRVLGVPTVTDPRRGISAGARIGFAVLPPGQAQSMAHQV